MPVTAIRFPAIRDEPFELEETRHFGRWMFRDEGFLAIHARDGARLVEAYLLRPGAGYRCLQAGSRDHGQPGSPVELIARFYPEVPLKRPAAELDSLCDLAALREAVGFEPQERLWP